MHRETFLKVIALLIAICFIGCSADSNRATENRVIELLIDLKKKCKGRQTAGVDHRRSLYSDQNLKHIEETAKKIKKLKCGVIVTLEQIVFREFPLQENGEFGFILDEENSILDLGRQVLKRIDPNFNKEKYDFNVYPSLEGEPAYFMKYIDFNRYINDKKFDEKSWVEGKGLEKRHITEYRYKGVVIACKIVSKEDYSIINDYRYDPKYIVSMNGVGLCSCQRRFEPFEVADVIKLSYGRIGKKFNEIENRKDISKVIKELSETRHRDVTVTKRRTYLINGIDTYQLKGSSAICCKYSKRDVIKISFENRDEIIVNAPSSGFPESIKESFRLYREIGELAN